MTISTKRKQTPPLQPKDDLTRLRSASPAIKRPASDMGAQDREEHLKDVEMSDVTAPPTFLITSETQSASDLKKQDTGKTHSDRSENTSHDSHPGTVLQSTSSETGPASESALLHSSPSSHSLNSTQTSGILPTCTDLPSYDDQVAKVQELQKNEVIAGEKGFLVPQKWWNRVQARSSHPAPNTDKDAAEGEVGPIDNASLAMVTEDSGKLLDLAGDKFVTLRPGLRYGDDYQIVTQETWDLIVSWYGLAKDSPIITRHAHVVEQQDQAKPTVDFEIDPPVFTLLKVPCELTTQTQKEALASPPKLVGSKYMLAMDWLKKAKELVHVDPKTKVRAWRILGGLKSHTASGLPSPAASRSASPAPGTEIVATVPDKMLLDVNTFAALLSKEHRDELDISDHTADQNYNGSSKLHLYTGRSELIAIEEQKKSGEWPSETNRMALPKNAKDKVKGLAPSGRSSPSPGMTTRGRAQREGRPRGNAGLTNLGNTCYMNSALQSIRSVHELTEYFLTGSWKQELNRGNPLGHGGQFARAYANLVQNIFDERGNAYTPREFKNTVGRFHASFSGYGQQDSQEFLLFLLDGLSEDLNRILKKPYIEKPDSTDEMVHDHVALMEFAERNWDIYKARNDSIVTDLFAGMYKSTLTCPVCDKVSIIFDPFNNLTLQLPIESTWSKQCFFVPRVGPAKRLEVEVEKVASILAVKQFVAERVGARADHLIMAEGYRSRFYKIFDNTLTISEAGINVQQDYIFFLEVEDIATNYNPDKKQAYSAFSSTTDADEVVDISSSKADKLLVPIFHRQHRPAGEHKRVGPRPFFAFGTFIVIDREENKSYDAILRKILGKVAGMTSRNILQEVEDDDSSDAVIVNDDSSRSGGHSTEDGFVDVSMRDASEAPGSEDSDSARTVDRFLRTKGPVPQALAQLFQVMVKDTKEGVPTGWNNISEHDTLTEVLSRVPKTSRSTTSPSASDDSGASVADDSAGDSDASTQHAEPDADSLMPENDDDHTAAMFNRFGKSSNRGKREKKVYGRKKHRNLPEKRQPRTRVNPQPVPVDDEFAMLVRPGEAIVCDWTQEGYDALFGGDDVADDEQDARGHRLWSSVPLLPDVALEKKRQLRNRRQKDGVSLEDCLDEFGKAETLSEQNAWYCPRCKEHRRAEKKFELWKVPDMLIMHLKRFSSQRNLRDKLDVHVEYPVEGLDMAKYVQDPEGKVLIYDLIAVDNHYGGLGGGHYTAFAKNFTTNDWFDFNDGHVSKRSPEQVVTSAAYILFYRRRQEYPLGGEHVQKLLADEGHISDGSSNGAADNAGNGRRLGDSSQQQAGSSGLGGAGAAHHSGVGGLREESPDLLADRDSQTTMDLDGRLGERTQPEPMGPVWGSVEEWSFANVPSAQDLEHHDASDTQSLDSTKVQGGDGRGSSPVEDPMMFSDALEDGDTTSAAASRAARIMRESAPPPSYEVAVGGYGVDDTADDTDDELPVAELLANEDGEMEVSYADK